MNLKVSDKTDSYLMKLVRFDEEEFAENGLREFLEGITLSSDLDNMIIYYKTATGTWINGLTGSPIEVPETFEINYTNIMPFDYFKNLYTSFI